MDIRVRVTKPKQRAPTFLPEGYKRRIHWTETSRSPTGLSNPKGVVLQGEHWDGSVDGVAKPVPVKVKLRDSLEEAGIPWKIVTLDNGRQLCLPKSALQGDGNPLTHQLIKGR